MTRTTGRTRWAIIALAGAGACVLALSLRGKPATAHVDAKQDTKAATTVVKAAPRATESGDTIPARAEVEPVKPITAEEKRARDTAVMAGVHQFERDAIVEMNRCMGPTPGMRTPRTVVMTFERKADEESLAAGRDHFTAANVHSPPQRGTPAIDPVSKVGRCLSQLEGGSLYVATGNAPDGDQFQQIVTLFLPTQTP